MKNRKIRRGSVTVWLALFLGVLMPLLMAGIISVRSAADRVQILDGVQTGLYSLFGQYDRSCFRKYGILVLDTGCGSENSSLPVILDIFRKYCDPVLRENGRNIHVTGGGFSGYRTAAENDGEAFYQQAVRYMEKRREAGRAELCDTSGDRSAELEISREADLGRAFESEDHHMPEAVLSLEEGTWDGTAEETASMILDERAVSGKTLKGEGASLKGNLSPGAPVCDGFTGDASEGSEALFRAYFSEKLGTFRKPSGGGLDYEMEYLAFGRSSDRENLAAVILELLLCREGVNYQKLLENDLRMEQIGQKAERLAIEQKESEVLISGLKEADAPPSEETVDAFRKRLAFLEIRKKSVEEVLGILNGNKADGIGYEDFVRALTSRNGRSLLVMRTMKMEELNLRETEREEFCFGNCIVALEVFLDVDADGREFHVSRSFCYD